MKQIAVVYLLGFIANILYFAYSVVSVAIRQSWSWKELFDNISWKRTVPIILLSWLGMSFYLGYHARDNNWV